MVHLKCLVQVWTAVKQVLGGFLNEIPSVNEEEGLLDVKAKKSKSYGVFVGTMNRANWSTITRFTPIFETFSTVLIFLKSDACSTSVIPYAFATLLEIFDAKLDTDRVR